MLNLKSELIKKQKEVDEQKSKNVGSMFISAKPKGNSKTIPPWMKKNPGIEDRNKRDLSEVVVEEKHTQVQAILEAKSKMYDKMTSGDIIPDSEDAQMFLVDFEQKSIDAWRDKRERDNSAVPKVNAKVKSDVKKVIDDAKDQWVEYVDSLGRTRTCLKKDLPSLEKMDRNISAGKPEGRTLMSDDMRREEERLKWEEDALKEQDDMHYENLRFGEVRELGVGYYTFSGKQEEREEQMKRLDQLRKDTEKQQRANEVKKQKQQTQLAARLEKVRQRRIKQLKEKGQEIPASLLEPVKIEPPKPKISQESNNAATSSNATSTVNVETTILLNKVRDWDKGKEWLPAKAPELPKSWADPHKERLSEFAPPSSYYPDKPTKREHPKDPPDEIKQQKLDNVESEAEFSKPLTDNDRIQRLLSQVASSATNAQSSNLTSPVPVSDTVEPAPSTSADSEPLPFVPSDKPISLKVKSKPSKLLNTKSAFES